MKHGHKKSFGKLQALLCACCMAAALFSPEIKAHAQGGLQIISSAAPSEKGGGAAVTFALKDNPGIWGIKLKVSYDHSALTLLSVENGSLFAIGEITLPDRFDKEQFIFVAAADNLKEVTADGTLMTLHFRAAEGAEPAGYQVTAEAAESIDSEGRAVRLSAAPAGSAAAAAADKKAPALSEAVQAEGAGQKADAPEKQTSDPEKQPDAGEENNTLITADAGGKKTDSPLLWVIVVAAALLGGVGFYIFGARRLRNKEQQGTES